MLEKQKSLSKHAQTDTQLEFPQPEDGQYIKEAQCYPSIDVNKVINSLRPILVGKIYWDKVANGLYFPKGGLMDTYLHATDIDGCVGFVHVLSDDKTID